MPCLDIIIYSFILEWDVDECKEGTHNCSVAQTCSNRYLSYKCKCPRGFTGENCDIGMRVSCFKNNGSFTRVVSRLAICNYSSCVVSGLGSILFLFTNRVRVKV